MLFLITNFFAFLQSNCVFPIKHIRILDLLDWTLESPQQDCHKPRRTLMSPQERLSHVLRSPFFLSFRAFLESEKTYLVQKVGGFLFSPLHDLYEMVNCSHLSDPLKSGPLHSQQAHHWDQLHHMGGWDPSHSPAKPAFGLGISWNCWHGIESGFLHSQTAIFFYAEIVSLSWLERRYWPISLSSSRIEFLF